MTVRLLPSTVDNRAMRWHRLRRVWTQFRRSLVGLLGLGIIVGFLLIGLLAPRIAPHDPYEVDFEASLRRPSAGHPFGQDELGRDVASRIIYGARISLVIGVIAVAIGIAVGVPLGALSGYYGGWPDLLTQRVVDIMLAFPGILLAIVIVAVLGVGLPQAMIAIGIVSIPVYARLVRAQTLAVRNQEFVEAARALGAGVGRIVARYILPNALPVIIVQSTLQVASAILTAAALGFLGLGAQPPAAEWGAMLSAARQYLRLAPHAVTVPGLAIMITVLGFNLLGDAVRDALDPRMRV